MQYICKGISVNLTVDNLFNYVPASYSAVSPSTTGTSFSVSTTIDLYKLTHRKEKDQKN